MQHPGDIYPDVTIVGTGIKSADQLTRETIAAIDASREVLYVDPAVGTRAFLQAHCKHVTSLYTQSYQADRNRLVGYKHMAIKVIEAALDHSPVTFAMHGHPVVFCQAPLLIKKMAAALGLSLQVLPGVSSMDCLFADLMMDPASSGLLMYEATDLLLRWRPLVPEVPTLIWQVGNLETRLHTSRTSRPERLDRFAAYLATAYEPNHLVTACYASPHAFAPANVFTFPLRKIREHAAQLHAGITLYLPAARSRPVVDEDLLHDIDDPAHLHRVTR